MIRVIKDGRIESIPERNIEKVLKRGWKVYVEKPKVKRVKKTDNKIIVVDETNQEG